MSCSPSTKPVYEARCAKVALRALRKVPLTGRSVPSSSMYSGFKVSFLLTWRCTRHGRWALGSLCTLLFVTLLSPLASDALLGQDGSTSRQQWLWWLVRLEETICLKATNFNLVLTYVLFSLRTLTQLRSSVPNSSSTCSFSHRGLYTAERSLKASPGCRLRLFLAYFEDTHGTGAFVQYFSSKCGPCEDCLCAGCESALKPLCNTVVVKRVKTNPKVESLLLP